MKKIFYISLPLLLFPFIAKANYGAGVISRMFLIWGIIISIYVLIVESVSAYIYFRKIKQKIKFLYAFSVVFSANLFSGIIGFLFTFKASKLIDDNMGYTFFYFFVSIILEFIILYFILRKDIRIKNLFICSVIINFISYFPLLLISLIDFYYLL